MKHFKKLMAMLFMLAVVCGCVAATSVEAQAATKKSTYVMDQKNKVYAQSKIRVGVNSRVYGYNTEIFLGKSGDYVASVKTSSPALIAKVTYKNVYSGKSGYTSMTMDDGKTEKFVSSYGIAFFTEKKGTYTATVTIKNAKKKTVCTKKIKVYAEDYDYPIQYVKYGKEYAGGLLTTKKSGKIIVKMNPGFKLVKIEVGKYEDKKYESYSPEPTFKKIKNNAKITLATSTAYDANYDAYNIGTEQEIVNGNRVDYLFPVTIIRITYKDTKLGIVQTTDYDIFLKK